MSRTDKDIPYRVALRHAGRDDHDHSTSDCDIDDAQFSETTPGVSVTYKHGMRQCKKYELVEITECHHDESGRPTTTPLNGMRPCRTSKRYSFTWSRGVDELRSVPYTHTRIDYRYDETASCSCDKLLPAWFSCGYRSLWAFEHPAGFKRNGMFRCGCCSPINRRVKRTAIKQELRGFTGAVMDDEAYDDVSI